MEDRTWSEGLVAFPLHMSKHLFRRHGACPPKMPCNWRFHRLQFQPLDQGLSGVAALEARSGISQTQKPQKGTWTVAIPFGCGPVGAWDVGQMLATGGMRCLPAALGQMRRQQRAMFWS